MGSQSFITETGFQGEILKFSQERRVIAFERWQQTSYVAHCGAAFRGNNRLFRCSTCRRFVGIDGHSRELPEVSEISLNFQMKKIEMLRDLSKRRGSRALIWIRFCFWPGPGPPARLRACTCARPTSAASSPAASDCNSAPRRSSSHAIFRRPVFISALICSRILLCVSTCRYVLMS